MPFNIFGGFSFFSLMFNLIFLLVFATIVVTLIKSLVTWSHNNASPRLSVDAKVVTKRVDMRVRRYHHGSDADLHMSTSSFNTYYVTFEVESGDRMELVIPDYEYGLIAEGDHGKLTFQGTRFVSFQRS